MKAVHQLKTWYVKHVPPMLAEALPQAPDSALWEDPVPGEDHQENFAWLRHWRYASEGNHQHRSFGQSAWLELWEKSRLFSLGEVEQMALPLQAEMATCMMLNAALDCDEPQARVAAASVISPGAYTRPLIRKLYRDLSQEEKESALRQLRENICQRKETEAALQLKLEIWAAHPGGTMTTVLMKQLLDRCFPSEHLLRALLQCAGENRHDQGLLMEWLKETDFGFCSPRLQQAMMDYCGVMANSLTHDLLLTWKQDLKCRSSVEDWIPEYLSLTIDDCRRRMSPHKVHQQITESPTPSRKTITLAQFMFYGDLMLPGKANSGGIATLLRTLGDTLAEEEGINLVYTFMMMPCDERAGDSPLTTELSPGHTLVRVPVFFDETCSPELFQEKEYDIGHTLDRMLNLLQIEPDIYHMRYADNASLAAALLAKKRSRKAVFTLTPDPHRNINVRDEMATQSSDGTLLQGVDGMETLMVQLNKVRAADDILHLCDGVLGIGTPELAPPLTAYFPQLKENLGKNALTFRMIPEGIRLNDGEKEERMDPWQLFSAPDGKHRLARERKQLPVMLTVGRLDPVKGQMALLEAWSHNQLWQAYNLVLIGGDLEQPDVKEKKILREIDIFMEKHPHLKGRFCHLERMDNEPLRRLQRNLAEGWEGDLPPVYIAPSIKEEFGLSIIEAMAAGLVSLAPRAGGVGSYVTSGINGFLIETNNPDSLREELAATLLKSNRRREEWEAIAARGKDTVKKRFDIGSIAREFTQFYQAVLGEKTPAKTRILFLTPPFYSHFAPMLTLAKCFSQEGWETIVGTDEAFKEQVEDASLIFEKVLVSRNANTGIAEKTQQEEDEQARLEAFFQATHQGPEETLLVQSRHRQSDMLSDPEGLMSQIRTLGGKHHPDLWVVDQLSYGATLALQCLGLPFVTFCPPHPFSIPQVEGLFGVPQRWPGAFHPDPGKMAVLEKAATHVRSCFTDFFNETLQRYGKQRVNNAFSQTSSLAVVYNYPLTPSVEAQQGDKHAKKIYAGYCFETKCLSSEWERKMGAFRQGNPKILLSFGTFLSRRSDLLEKCVRWIRQAYPESSVVVAAGGNVEKLRHLQEEKVLVEDFVPQAALYPEVDLVIHHGGNNTFTECLYHGKPMIIFPFSSDQFHVGADGEDMGVAQVLVPNEVTSEIFLQGMKKMLAGETLERTLYWQDVLHHLGPESAAREVIRCWETGDWT